MSKADRLGGVGGVLVYDRLVEAFTSPVPRMWFFKLFADRLEIVL